MKHILRTGHGFRLCFFGLENCEKNVQLPMVSISKKPNMVYLLHHQSVYLKELLATACNGIQPDPDPVVKIVTRNGAVHQQNRDLLCNKNNMAVI